MSSILDNILPGISSLKDKIDSILGKDMWFDYEPETIINELAVPLWSQNLEDKIAVLKILGVKPQLFYEDFWFTLMAAEAINGNPVDFSNVPSMTSLELAFAIVEVQKVLVSSGVTPRYTDGFIEATALILVGEGYSEPVSPFGFVPKDLLSAGQTKNDSDDKAKAIQLYLRHKLTND